MVHPQKESPRSSWQRTVTVPVDDVRLRFREEKAQFVDIDDFDLEYSAGCKESGSEHYPWIKDES